MASMQPSKKKNNCMSKFVSYGRQPPPPLSDDNRLTDLTLEPY